MNDDEKPLTTARLGIRGRGLPAEAGRRAGARGRGARRACCSASTPPPAASRRGTGPPTSRARCSLAAAALGGLKIQLCFYRGFGEFKVSPWTSRAAELVRMMTSVSCRAGETQIRQVLQHAVNEAQKERVSALVFVGDCVRGECRRAGDDRRATGDARRACVHVPRGAVIRSPPTRSRRSPASASGAYCQFDASQRRRAAPSAVRRRRLCGRWPGGAARSAMTGGSRGEADRPSDAHDVGR